MRPRPSHDDQDRRHPAKKPVPTSCSIQTTLVMWCQLQWFCTGLYCSSGVNGKDGMHSYASIEPDQDLLWLVRICRWPEPEVQLFVAVASDGQLSGIRLSGIKSVDVSDYQTQSY
jgi:hypothetical protein